MPVTLYERLCDDDRRPSPYCWRARFALAHKGLTPECLGVKFTEGDKVAFSGQKKVPVLIDGERVVYDSWSIACYLDETYPDAPALFGDEQSKALARFVSFWTDESLQKAFAGVLVPSLALVTHPDDREYFQQTREAFLGISFEDLRKQRAARIATLQQAFAPLRALLAEQPFVCGKDAAYADYIVFGAFQWARCVDPEDLVSADDAAVRAWRARMLELFGGLARQVTAFAEAA